MVDLKELKRLIKYLRKEGIVEFKSGDLEFKITPLSPKISKKKTLDPIESAIDSDYPTHEEMLFYSAGGLANKPEGN